MVLNNEERAILEEVLNNVDPDVQCGDSELTNGMRIRLYRMSCVFDPRRTTLELHFVSMLHDGHLPADRKLDRGAVADLLGSFPQHRFEDTHLSAEQLLLLQEVLDQVDPDGHCGDQALTNGERIRMYRLSARGDERRRRLEYTFECLSLYDQIPEDRKLERGALADLLGSYYADEA